MLLRRLLHSSRHLRHRLQTLTPASTAASSSAVPARLPFFPLPSSRLLWPRLLSTSGRDDDPSKPWAFTLDSGDPDPFAGEDVEVPAGEDPLGASTAGEDPWAKDFRAEDSEKGDVFEEIFKEEAATATATAAAPASGEKAPASTDELWTLSGDDEKDPFAEAVLGEGLEGIGGEGAAIGDVDAEEDEEEAERKRQANRAREQELMETLKGPNRAFGDLIEASGITEDMIASLILLKDVRGVPGLPPLQEIEDRAIEKMNATSSRAEVERQKQEEIAKARVRQVDEKGRAYGTGKRKCSIARVWIKPGDGKFIVNDKQFDAYFPILDHRADLLRPFTVTKTLGHWDVTCTVKGGGVSGQVGAIRLGISRALQNWEPGLRPYLKAAGYLTRDSRVVERKKPGKAKARKSFQWVKR
ncbi:30S ribosomal protein S9, mitochondrial [Oryza brachyantha]|uniref:30S ribosomal protein S9 n=1 Tax=Oryza brachyantha TaxID=4533 RepID=J3MNP8_ORYBR|nr:30S ribosomal protein S9, mitochondrial [Oryza brachyantha]XP_006658061.1 30S ribosomal protein S9, mitochondrial [Oryza brachyantha]